MRCPVCKADNSPGTACRRCKADLTLLWQAESRREALLASARRRLQDGDWSAAASDALQALRLRSGEDAARLLATSRLVCRDFAGAWRAYLQAKRCVE